MAGLAVRGDPVVNPTASPWCTVLVDAFRTLNLRLSLG